MRTRERTARVFVSSTFKDMHAERDHLVTVVFPELRERMQRLGLELFDVDLRWGIPRTGVDGERANPWEYCRKWIDRVEPFFICVLGQRYGWVPAEEEIRDPGERAACRGMSITELEVRRALFSEAHRRRAFFYLRGVPVPAGASDEARERFVEPAAGAARLGALEELMRGSGRPVRRYPCRWNGSGFEDLDAFGRMVLEDLWSGLLRDPRFVAPERWDELLAEEPGQARLRADEAAPIPPEVWERLLARARPLPHDPVEAEAEQMADFAASRLRWFQGREKELAELGAFAGELPDEASRLCLVRGAPGLGKSALLARLAGQLSGSGHLVVAHFAGATEGSAGLRTVLARLVQELDRGGVTGSGEGQPALDASALARELSERLERHRGARRVVLILDAVDQILGGQDLGWLPRALGPEVRVIVSCATSGPPGSASAVALAALEHRLPEPFTVELSGLGAAEIREVVRGHLAEYCRELDPADVEAIAALPQAGNPLYLMVLLHELRGLGGDDLHRKVSEIIGDLPRQRPDPAALFDWLLERLERAFGEGQTRLWCSCLGLSRAGLSSRELRDLLARELGPEAGAAALRIERAIRPYLMLRPEALAFFHGQLGEAIQRRWLAEEASRAQLHGRIADYLGTRWAGPSRRALEELPFHLAAAGRSQALASLLTDLRYLQARTEHGDLHALIDDYRLAEAGAGPELEQVPDFLRRHAGRLLRYPASLFSLVQLEGSEALRGRAEALLAQGGWTRPWLRTAPVPLAPPPDEPGPATERLERLASCEVRSAACALAPAARLAFVLLRLGEIGVVKVDEGRLRPTRVPVRRIRPLAVACSPDGSHLAVAGEDGRAEVLALTGEPGMPGMLGRELASLELRLPEYAAPALAFAGGALWSQAPDGAVRRLDLAGGAQEAVTGAMPDQVELAAVVETDGGTLVALREPGGTRLVRLAAGGARAELWLPQADAVAACSFGPQRVALALNPRRVAVVSAAAGLALDAEASLGRAPVALAAAGDRLFCVDDMGRLHAWRPGTAPGPDEIGLQGDAMRLLACPGDDTLLAAGPTGTVHLRLAPSRRDGGRDRLLAVFERPDAEGPCAVAGDGRRLSILTATSRRPVAELTAHERFSLFAQDGRGRLLLAAFGRGEAWIAEGSSGRARAVRCPVDLGAVAGAPGEGFWLLTERGELFRLDPAGGCRLVRREQEEILGGIALHAWPGLVAWVAHVRREADTVPRLSWLRSAPGALDPAPDAPVSSRHFTVGDGRLEALAFDAPRDRLATLWGGAPAPGCVRWGRPEDFQARREDAVPFLLPDHPTGARFDASGRGLYVLTGGGALLRLDVPGFTVSAALAGSEPFTSWEDGSGAAAGADRILLIQAGARALTCRFQEARP